MAASNFADACICWHLNSFFVNLLMELSSKEDIRSKKSVRGRMPRSLPTEDTLMKAWFDSILITKESTDSFFMKIFADCVFSRDRTLCCQTLS